MPTQYTVKEGDCLSSIAAKSGLTWKKLWDDPANAQLKTLRKDPSVLNPGDVVTIPDKEIKEEPRPTDVRHKFTKMIEPTHIKIRLLMDDQPRANLSYELQVGDVSATGTTDGNGYLQENIPPDATQGSLVVGEGTSKSIYTLNFGTLDPIETDDGVKERLVQLGYDADASLSDAVQGFQTHENMTVTGTVDDALRAKLKEIFGQ
jgi:N-acetylmuramoyl-L-alanine amidase